MYLEQGVRSLFGKPGLGDEPMHKKPWQDRTSTQDLQQLVNHFCLHSLACSSSAPEAPARGPAAAHSMHREQNLWESKEHHGCSSTKCCPEQAQVPTETRAEAGPPPMQAVLTPLSRAPAGKFTLPHTHSTRVQRLQAYSPWLMARAAQAPSDSVCPLSPRLVSDGCLTPSGRAVRSVITMFDSVARRQTLSLHAEFVCTQCCPVQEPA